MQEYRLEAGLPISKQPATSTHRLCKIHDSPDVNLQINAKLNPEPKSGFSLLTSVLGPLKQRGRYLGFMGSQQCLQHAATSCTDHVGLAGASSCSLGLDTGLYVKGLSQACMLATSSWLRGIFMHNHPRVRTSFWSSRVWSFLRRVSPC